MFRDKLSQFFHLRGGLFLVTLVFVTGAALLFWLDFFRTYEAQIDILVIGKTPATATEQVVENIAALPSNLSFYERVMASNALLEDADEAFVGLNPDERKALWQETLSVKQQNRSGMLVLTVRHPRSELATLLVKQCVQELFAEVSFYYNIKTDIDLRIVDGPLVRVVLSHPLTYVATSAGTGLFVTTLFFWLLHFVPSVYGQRKKAPAIILIEPAAAEQGESDEKLYRSFNSAESMPLIDPKKFLPLRPKTLTFETPKPENTQPKSESGAQSVSHSFIQPKNAEMSAEMPVSSVPNLPVVALEDLPFQFEAREDEGEEEPISTTTPEASARVGENKADTTAVPEKSAAEPTVEEYKRRLNVLLRGGKS